jgi:hypothetical protein
VTAYPIVDTSFYSYYTDDDQDINRYMEKCWIDSQMNAQAWQWEAEVDTRFRAGDQTIWGYLYGFLPPNRWKTFNFNRTQPICNMIEGYQMLHRKNIIATAVHNKNSVAASQHTKCLFHAQNTTNFGQVFSEAVNYSITTGLGLISIWMDWRTDPVNGDFRADALAYNQFIIDPYMKKKDLSDCNYIWQRRWYTKNQLIGLVPAQEDYIRSLRGDQKIDGKFTLAPENYRLGIRDLIPYDEFYYLDKRTATILVDTRNQGGDTREWQGTKEDLREFQRDFPWVEVIKMDVPSVKLAIRIKDRVVYNGPQPMEIDRYPFAPVWCYWYPEQPYFQYKIQGVVRGLRDAQYLYNRRKIIELDILESQANSGYIYNEGALVDPHDIHLAGQGVGIPVKDGRSIDEVRKIEPGQVPPSMIQLSEILTRELKEISGVNEELLGSAVDDKAGILGMLRQGAGLTTLQFIFDNADFAQKMCGEIFMEAQQRNWTPGKVERICNEKPADEFYHRSFAKYDVVIEEGLYSATQRQMQFAQGLELIKLGVPITPDQLVEWSTITDKRSLVEGIAAKQKQAEEMQQQEQQLKMQLLQAQMKDLAARSMANEGLGLERVSRVQENRALAVERISAAHKDEDQATLNKIKGLKELEGMDIAHLNQLLEVVNAIKELGQKEKLASEEKEQQGQAGQQTNI